jgi:TonB family protein
MKNLDKHFEGEIVFRLTIVADGSIKDIKIISSTTDYTEFDGEIQRAVGRWKFPKVKSGETVVTFPVRFYENTEWSSSSQSK